MICKKCGTENTGDSNFCTNCGGVLDSTIVNDVVEVNRIQPQQVEVINETNQKPSRGKAIAGFICSLCGILTCGISSVVGLILSIIGLSESRKRGETDGLAIAGIIFSSLIVLFFIYCMIMAAVSPEEPTTPSTSSTPTETVEPTKKEESKEEEKKEIPDFSSMSKEDVQNWCKNNSIVCYIKEENSESVAKGGYINQDKAAGTKINTNASITITYSLGSRYQSVTVDELKSELENNAAAAKEKYNGKELAIKGKLKVIDSDLKYIGIYALDNDWDFIGIHCTLKDSTNKEKVKTLTTGQTITVRGKVTSVGEVLGYYVDVKEIIVQ